MNQYEADQRMILTFINAVQAIRVDDPVVVKFEGKDATITPQLTDAMKPKVIDVTKKLFIEHKHLGFNTEQIRYFLALIHDTISRRLHQVEDFRHFLVHVFAFFIKILEYQKNNSNFVARRSDTEPYRRL